MKDDYTPLAVLARSAVGGTWIAVGPWVENERDDLVDPCRCDLSLDDDTPEEEKLQRATALYIAAAQPQNVLSMIREIRTLRKGYKHLLAQINTRPMRIDDAQPAHKEEQ